MERKVNEDESEGKGWEGVKNRWGEKEQSGGGDEQRQGETEPEKARRGEASGGNMYLGLFAQLRRLCRTHLHADHMPQCTTFTDISSPFSNTISNSLEQTAEIPPPSKKERFVPQTDAHKFSVTVQLQHPRHVSQFLTRRTTSTVSISTFVMKLRGGGGTMLILPWGTRQEEKKQDSKLLISFICSQNVCLINFYCLRSTNLSAAKHSILCWQTEWVCRIRAAAFAGCSEQFYQFS